MEIYSRGFYPQRRQRTRNQQRHRLFIQQKLMGVVLILISVLLVWLALTGKNFEDKDCTAIFFTVPLALYLLFTKHIVIV